MTNELLSNELLSDKLLSDEQLDDVTGGTKNENTWDAILLKASNAGRAQVGDVNVNTLSRDMDALQRTWAKLGVATVLYNDDNTPNEYYVNGEKLTHTEVIKFLFSK